MKKEIKSHEIEYSIDISDTNYINVVIDKEMTLDEFHKVLTIEDKLEIHEVCENETYRYNVIIAKIEQINGRTFKLHQTIRTKCYDYLIPSVTISQNTLLKSRLLNVYISEDYKYLYLMYRFYPFEWFRDFETQSFKSLHNYVGMERSECKTLALFKFKIQPRFCNDVVKFFEGLYHKFSSGYKLELKAFYSKMYQFTKISQVVENSEELRTELGTKLGMKIPYSLGLDSKPIPKLEIWKKTS